jgi:hypothetical protein
MRRLRLYRLIERTQGTITEIEAELRGRGVAVAGPPRHRGKPLPSLPPPCTPRPERPNCACLWGYGSSGACFQRAARLDKLPVGFGCRSRGSSELLISGGSSPIRISVQ